jgi:hypothetical protein
MVEMPITMTGVYGNAVLWKMTITQQRRWSV